MEKVKRKAKLEIFDHHHHRSPDPGVRSLEFSSTVVPVNSVFAMSKIRDRPTTRTEWTPFPPLRSVFDGSGGFSKRTPCTGFLVGGGGFFPRTGWARHRTTIRGLPSLYPVRLLESLDLDLIP